MAQPQPPLKLLNHLNYIRVAKNNEENNQQRAKAAMALYEEKYYCSVYEKKTTDLFTSIGISVDSSK